MSRFREADCTGPTNRQIARPATQNTIVGSKASTTRPSTMMPAQPAMITGRGPTRSSTLPPRNTPTPATRFAAMPKTMISTAPKP